jgi:hypothetical protein
MTESISDVPLLIRREIEARVLAPFVDALSQRGPREEVVAILGETIKKIAREQGAQFAIASGHNDLAAFKQMIEKWREGGALEFTVIRDDPQHLDFNVTRCRFAEMYRRLGIPELGETLSCNRDFVASEGFNPHLKLTRTQTIMAGATHCDFRYRLATAPKAGGKEQA